MGEVISHNQRQFEWDPWGRLLKVTDGAFSWEASYDALGRRLQTRYTPIHSSTLTMTSFYDPEEEFQEIGIQYAGKTFWKIYGPVSCDAIIDETGTSAILVYNALGHLARVVSQKGTLNTEHFPTSSYGPQTILSFIPTDLLSYAQSLAWHSKGQDPTGLIWMGARYYDPRGGRFISPDPIGYPICLDLYAYAGGDPVNYIDPDGRFASKVYDVTKPTLINLQGNLSNILGGTFLGASDFVNSTIKSWANMGQYAVNDFLEDHFMPQQKGLILAARDAHLADLQKNIEQSIMGRFDFDAGSERALAYRQYSYVGLQVLDFFRGSLINPKAIFSLSKQAHQLQNINKSLQPNGKFYSVAFETRLNTTSYPGISRARHFQEANTALLKSMTENAQFSQMMQRLGINLEKTASGLAPRTPPVGWTWHHAKEIGVMQLVPRTQHSPGSIYWNTLHPGGQGGYSKWGQ